MAKLVSRLNLIIGGAETAAQIAIQDTGDFILNLVRVLAPVDTGWLRDSYQKDTITPLHLLIGSMVNYSVFQEYGTSRQAGKPHLTPAFVQAESFFYRRLAERIRNLG